MKSLKRLLIPALLLSAFFTNAQDERQSKDRVASLKIGFLTKRLDLTPEEAKSFWPVYNHFQDELEQLHKSRRDNLNNAQLNFEEMSDAEVEKTIDNELSYRQNELDLIKKYQPQFKRVLPIKKVARLFRAEEDFKRKLLDMIQERREDRRPMQDRKSLPKK